MVYLDIRWTWGGMAHSQKYRRWLQPQTTHDREVDVRQSWQCSWVQKVASQLYNYGRNVPLLRTSTQCPGTYITAHDLFYQTFLCVSTTSNKCWGEKDWVQGCYFARFTMGGFQRLPANMITQWSFQRNSWWKVIELSPPKEMNVLKKIFYHWRLWVKSSKVALSLVTRLWQQGEVCDNRIVAGSLYLTLLYFFWTGSSHNFHFSGQIILITWVLHSFDTDLCKKPIPAVIANETWTTI